MGLLTRTAQVGAKVNAVEGVREALVAADYAIEFKEDQFARDVARYQRGVKRPGLSTPKDIIGSAYGKLPVTVELIGGAAGAAAREPWYDMVRGCGFSMATLKKIICVEGAVSDKFVPGSTFGNNAVAGSATHVGRIEWIGIVATKVNIVYKPITGVFADLDVLTGYHAGSGGTLAENGPPVDAGKVFELMSETASQIPPDLSVEFRDGEDVNLLVGARGDFEMTFNWGEVPLGKFAFEGPSVLQTYPGIPIRAGFVASIPAVAAPTYLQGKVGLPFLLDAHAPVLDTVSLKLGNVLTPRKTISTAGVISYIDGSLTGGYMPTRITDRKPMLSISVDRPGQAVYDWFRKWLENTEMALYAQNGILTTAGQNALIVRGPSVTVDGDSMSDADKNGVRAIGLDLKFNGNSDDELYISHVFI